MSAVVAAAAPRQLSERTKRWVSEATAYSARAGPDAQAVAFGRQWGLGHALLQTGRDGADHPLTRDGRTWLAADARFDAREELVSSLRANSEAGDAARSDPELLLAAYQVWGEAFLERVAGDFAFALWDDARRQLFCGRDQLGVLPLHYARAGDEILIATALGALLLHPDVSDELDESTIADHLLNARGDFGSTTFCAIRTLAPAHAGTWSRRELRLRRYWRQERWPPLLRFKTAEQYRHRFRELLEAAVADRITDRRLAAHVSGGLDSTSVAAVAQRIIRARGLAVGALRGSTMVVGGATDDQEGHYAQLVADALGVELDLLDESQFEPLDPFAAVDPVAGLPEPHQYRWTGLEYESLRLSAGHARVLLTGIPADGLLMFVPWYWLEWVAHGRLPRLGAAWMQQARLFGGRPHPHIKRSAGVLGAAARNAGDPLPPWLSDDFARRADAKRRVRAGRLAHLRGMDVQSLSREPGWSRWFAEGNPAYHRIPIAIRHPFADLRLLDFAARLAPEPWMSRKRILRDATRDLLPEAVSNRPKVWLPRGERASVTPEALDRLAELVRSVPEARRFVDPDALVDALLVPDAAQEHLRNFRLLRALGLVYWLAHWRRPCAADVGLEVGVKSNMAGERAL